MKLKFTETVTIFYSSIESIAIDTKKKEVYITTTSGARYTKRFNSVEDAIQYVDDLADDIAPNAKLKPKKGTNKKKST